jgi:hypothetical protein
MNNLVNENEILACDLRNSWKNEDKTETQKIVLLKLLCGLRNMFEVEKFILFCRDFDSLLHFARFPKLQREYLEVMMEMMSRFKAEMGYRLALFHKTLAATHKDLLTDSVYLKPFPVPAPDLLDWASFLDVFQSDMKKDFAKYGQDEWLYICFATKADSLTEEEKELIKLENTSFEADTRNLLEGFSQFGNESLSNEQKNFKDDYKSII